MADDVSFWQANPSMNFGWILRSGNEGINQTSRRFASRENLNTAIRPLLRIEYTLP